MPDHKVIILLYSGRSPLAWMIRFQTRSKYSHAAFLFGDTVVESVPWYGVRQREVNSDDAAADRYSVELTADQYVSLWYWCDERLGCKYDWLGILRFISRRHSHEDRRFFCSELIAEALYAVGIQLIRARPWMISPGLLSCSMLLTEER